MPSVEHTFLGTQCGIMDQMVSALGRKDRVLKLSCNNLNYEYFHLLTEDVTLMIINSGIKHHLPDSPYNKRREECAEALRLIREKYPKVQNLSDFSLIQLRKVKSDWPAVLYKRVKHVLLENLRVRETCEALYFNDFQTVGRLMLESHASLKNDFEVSSVELDFLVEHAENTTEVLGARMTGGGFGGCIIVLIQNKGRASFIKSLSQYKKHFGRDAEVYRAIPSDGVREIDIAELREEKNINQSSESKDTANAA